MESKIKSKETVDEIKSTTKVVVNKEEEKKDEESLVKKEDEKDPLIDMFYSEVVK